MLEVEYCNMHVYILYTLQWFFGTRKITFLGTFAIIIRPSLSHHCIFLCIIWRTLLHVALAEHCAGYTLWYSQHYNVIIISVLGFRTSIAIFWVAWQQSYEIWSNMSVKTWEVSLAGCHSFIILSSSTLYFYMCHLLGVPSLWNNGTPQSCTL